jgi:hypothetical protein
MKHHTEDPARHAGVCEQDIVFAEGIGRRDLRSYFRKPVLVREEVEEGEEHGKRLLHAEEAVKGPFAVELHDGLPLEDAGVGDYVLAGVVAFGGAGPEEEAMEERWERGLASCEWGRRGREWYGLQLRLFRCRSFLVDTPVGGLISKL